MQFESPQRDSSKLGMMPRLLAFRTSSRSLRRKFRISWGSEKSSIR